MIKGVYVALSGAVLRSQELDAVANNLANLNTTGYKKTSFSSRLYPLLEGIGEKQDAAYPGARDMAYFGKYSIDQSEGSIKVTGNPLDLAVKGEGFFEVRKGNQSFYTRNGSFTIDKSGALVTPNGYNVLDTTGRPINLTGGTITVTPDGTLSVDGLPAGKIKLSRLNNTLHASDSLFTGDDAGPADGLLVQGGLEMSNVNPIREMVGVTLAQRQYESALNVLQNLNDLAKMSTEIVRG